MQDEDMREMDPSEAADGETDPQTLADPPDMPMAVEGFGTTAEEGERGETLDERLRQEDQGSAADQLLGRVIDIEAEDQPDITPELIGFAIPQDQRELSAEEAA
ncbi:MAG TPA: hypothetical protein VNA87_01120, partial [Actinomycetota bacterium]|nr:hypothetical protein [Actinomycetota bacterium]